jgi:MinD superfamily P-loop ATPase
MTAQEKAEELFNKYFSEVRMPSDCEGCMMCVNRCGNMVAIAKKSALIAVDEIIANIEPSISMDLIEYRIKYWQEVKQELEKI